MTKKEEKLIIDTLSDISVQAIDMDCPKTYLNWAAEKEKKLIYELGLESEWDKAIYAKSAECLRKTVETKATDPISKALGTLLADIIAGLGEDEEEEDDE